MAKKDDDKPKTFNIRFNAEDWARVERIADHYALPMAGAIRMLLKREDDAIAVHEASRAKVLRKRTG